MSSPNQISLISAAQWFKGLPHQVRAFDYLEELLSLEELEHFANIYRNAAASQRIAAPYFWQLDNADQASRSCFSATCAMLLETLRPGTLSGSNGDFEYMETLDQYGDTTDAGAQIKTLRSFGIDCDFVTDGDFDLIEQQLKSGIPVPVGWLHKGPALSATGGGHWSLIVGALEEDFVLHDPFGRAEMSQGGYLSHGPLDGKFVRYQKNLFGPRWMVEGEGSGWCVVARNN